MIQEVTYRFKGLNLIDRVPDELWNKVVQEAEIRLYRQVVQVDIVQEAEIKTIPKESNAKGQNGCLRRPDKHL